MVSNREKVSRALGVLSDGLESVLGSKWFFCSELVFIAGMAALCAIGSLYGLANGLWAWGLGTATFYALASVVNERGVRNRLRDAEAMADKWFGMFTDESQSVDRLRKHAVEERRRYDGLKSIIHSLHWELEKLRGVWLTSVEPGEAFRFHSSEKMPTVFAESSVEWAGLWELDGFDEAMKTCWVRPAGVPKDDPKSYGMRILATTRVVRTEMPGFYAQEHN
jgi:hypothetical protein